MNTKLFQARPLEMELAKIQYQSLKKPTVSMPLKLNIDDVVKIKRTKGVCEFTIERHLFIEGELLFDVQVGIKSVKILADENISNEEVLKGLEKNFDVEFQAEMTQISLIITQNTLLTAVKGVVTPNQLIGRNISFEE